MVAAKDVPAFAVMAMSRIRQFPRLFSAVSCSKFSCQPRSRAPLCSSLRFTKPRTFAAATSPSESREKSPGTGSHVFNRSVDGIISRKRVAAVEAILMHEFADKSLLAQAMVHRSTANDERVSPAGLELENGRYEVVQGNNERMELLGDRVFGLLAVEHVFHTNKNLSEGAMSAMGHVLVSRKQAHQYCIKLGLAKFLIQSTALQQLPTAGARYGNFFEALLGALFLDGGYSAASRFFTRKVVPCIDEQECATVKSRDYKRELQEHLVASGLPTMALGVQLKYEMIHTDLSRGQQTFRRSLSLFGTLVSVGKGETRVAADQAAARRLLENLQKKTVTTCFLIRLARRAGDNAALGKLHATRKEQVQLAESGRKEGMF